MMGDSIMGSWGVGLLGGLNLRMSKRKVWRSWRRGEVIIWRFLLGLMIFRMECQKTKPYHSRFPTIFSWNKGYHSWRAGKVTLRGCVNPSLRWGHYKSHEYLFVRTRCLPLEIAAQVRKGGRWAVSGCYVVSPEFPRISYLGLCRDQSHPRNSLPIYEVPFPNAFYSFNCFWTKATNSSLLGDPTLLSECKGGSECKRGSEWGCKSARWWVFYHHYLHTCTSLSVFKLNVTTHNLDSSVRK